MRQPVPYRKGAVYGCLPDCQGNLSLAVSESALYGIFQYPRWIGSVKTALTPIRVVCNNTLNLALRTAKRSWSMIHTGDISGKIEEAKKHSALADEYMTALGQEFENLRKIKLSEKQVLSIY